MKQRNSLDRSSVHLLHRAYQAAGDIFQAEMKVDGLTPRQLAVLITIGQKEGLSQTDIVDSTGIDRSTVADMIRRLLERGLLKRRRTKEDARTYAVNLTNAGRRVLQMAAPMTRRIDERVLNALPTDHREQFIGALQTIVTILQSTSSRDGTPVVR
jgi:MarR family transcriptional regulator, temperature-dependent positive regulator of motility